MMSVMFYIIIVEEMGFGFEWIEDRKGEINIILEGKKYNVQMIKDVEGIVEIVEEVIIMWWIVKRIVKQKYKMRRNLRKRKSERGYKQIQKGMIEDGEGDEDEERRMKRKDGKMIR